MRVQQVVVGNYLSVYDRPSVECISGDRGEGMSLRHAYNVALSPVWHQTRYFVYPWCAHTTIFYLGVAERSFRVCARVVHA